MGKETRPVHLVGQFRNLIAAGLLAAALLCGCSSFNRNWRRARAQAVPANSFEGRWEGRWGSEVNGHHGALRCLLTPATNSVYHARFRATYARILHFSYTVPLTAQPHFGGWEFNGEADLGKLAGGVYDYEGRISSTNFLS